MTKKMKRSKFKARVSQNAHKQKSQRTQYGHLRLPKGVSVFREEPGGRAKLDFLPYEITDPHHPDRDDEMEISPGNPWYKRPYYLHRSVGVSNQSAVCPSSIGQRCPICEYRAQQLRSGADYNDDTIRALKPSLRNLYVVVPRGHKDYDEEPHIWDISQFLFQEMLNDELEEDEEYAIFPDPEEGLTLRIRFSEEKFGGNTFARTNRIDFDERDEAYDEETLKKVPNLDEVLVVPSYKELEMKFFELDAEPEAEESVEEKSEPSPPKRKRKKIKSEPETEKESDSEEDKSDSEEDKCPYGYRFGADCEEYDDCDDCDDETWQKCLDVKEGTK